MGSSILKCDFEYRSCNTLITILVCFNEMHYGNDSCCVVLNINLVNKELSAISDSSGST